MKAIPRRRLRTYLQKTVHYLSTYILLVRREEFAFQYAEGTLCDIVVGLEVFGCLGQ